MAALKLIVLAFVLFFVDVCKPDSLLVGSSANGRLAYVNNVKLSAIPLKTRTKTVFYNGNDTIKGISVIDSTKTKAVARITAGGISFTYANIKMKSERGEPLNYQIQIFV